MGRLTLSLAILASIVATSASAQERCFQAGASECKRSKPGQPRYLYTCEQYGGSLGLRLTFKGTVCEDTGGDCEALKKQFFAARAEHNSAGCNASSTTDPNLVSTCSALVSKQVALAQQLNKLQCRP